MPVVSACISGTSLVRAIQSVIGTDGAATVDSVFRVYIAIAGFPHISNEAATAFEKALDKHSSHLSDPTTPLGAAISRVRTEYWASKHGGNAGGKDVSTQAALEEKLCIQDGEVDAM
ncbi:hypothetical protein FISHEDRAFT_69918 [Fistulina hepatica ATCC 64428]|uniref:Uncharacterized protein n=1 Tax=Fistulina hepatica ATCC 64428 TaxID=1128425 RepID=A0A0D7ALN5_9AGAR|nr:hypothetical protein FISHEDRAFT_69918 [Fistulina hepatica ATCC 64428]